MKQLSKTTNPVVIRTDFDNQQAWEAICELLRAPVHASGETFYPCVDFLEDSDYRNLTKEELLAIVLLDHAHSFLFVVDRATIANPDFAILAVDLVGSRGRSFRAIPSQIQSIENNLSIANRTLKNSLKLLTRTESFEAFQGLIGGPAPNDKQAGVNQAAGCLVKYRQYSLQVNWSPATFAFFPFNYELPTGETRLKKVLLERD